MSYIVILMSFQTIYSINYGFRNLDTIERSCQNLQAGLQTNHLIGFVEFGSQSQPLFTSYKPACEF